jgi:hypothetical protein
VAAVKAWQAATPAAQWRLRAFTSIGWPNKGPWCAAWAHLIDHEANGGPSELYAKGYSSSCTRRCIWAPSGSGYRKGPKGERLPPVRPALGPQYLPQPPQAVEPGDIITVGRRKANGRWERPGGSHCTIAILVTDSGVYAIGGNQWGVRANGRRVSGDVVLTFYPFEEAGMAHDVVRVQWAVTIPEAEYPPARPAPTQAEIDAALAAVDARI